MGEDLLTGNVETELQGYKDCKLGGQQVLPVEPEYRLRLFYQHLELVTLAVIQLGGENETCSSTELPVDFVDDVLQHQFLEIYIGLVGKRPE